MSVLAGNTPPPNCGNVWEALPDMAVALGEVSAGIVQRNGSPHMCVFGQGSATIPCLNLGTQTWDNSAPQRPCRGDHHCTVQGPGAL